MKGSEKFVSDIRKTAKEHGVKIKFIDKPMIFAKGDPLGCTGYFDEEEMLLCVSNIKNRFSFITILAHESSHMDQFIHDKYLWEKSNPGYTLFFEWLSGNIEVKHEFLVEAVQDIIRLELDCERRALKKIAKYKLNINISDYIRSTNAYLRGYLFALETKHWTPQIYYDDDIVAACSTKLKKSYNHIPQRLHKLFLRKFKAE